jgi:hypothetical protein
MSAVNAPNNSGTVSKPVKGSLPLGGGVLPGGAADGGVDPGLFGAPPPLG